MAFDPATAHFWLGDEDLGQFDYGKQTVGEARFFKKITGLTPLQMMQGFESGDPDAMTGLVWLLWRRKGRLVDYNSVDFAMGDLTIKDADGNAPTAADIESAQAGLTGPTVPAGTATTPAGTSSGDGSSTSQPSPTSST